MTKIHSDDLRLKFMSPEELLAEIHWALIRHTTREPYSSNTIWRIHNRLHRYLELKAPTKNGDEK